MRRALGRRGNAGTSNRLTRAMPPAREKPGPTTRYQRAGTVNFSTAEGDPSCERGRQAGYWLRERSSCRIPENPCAMIEDQVIELIEPLLQAGGRSSKTGKSFASRRSRCFVIIASPVRLNWIPIVGNALSVVMVVRQPVDIEGSRTGYERLLTRLGMAVNGRFPPWRGLAIGLTALVLTPEPIGPGDDAMLQEVLGIKLRRMAWCRLA